MSGATDKARFFLEQAVPQLQEFREKKIFNEDEIRTLVKKRSDFEHKVLARGVQPVEFARYAAWEIDLENLRLKRCKRLKIKSSSTHSGQARIFTIFDRGTKKHPGDIPLWMSYLEYVRRVKATKKFKLVLTSAIRLHPTKPELWLYAARCTLEADADMNGARSYMQRGTRFCSTTRELWIEYAKLEMIYLAKIAMRRRILGLDMDNTVEASAENSEDDMDVEGFGDSDMIQIPDYKSNTIQPRMIEGVKVDAEATKDLMTTPALNGAIPLAIFDAARKQPFFCASAASDFFDMFATFTQVRCMPQILQHVLDAMTESYLADPYTCDCYTRQPIAGLDPHSADFVVALGDTLKRLKESSERTQDKKDFVKKTRTWISHILSHNDLDPGVHTVLKYTLNRLE